MVNSGSTHMVHFLLYQAVIAVLLLIYFGRYQNRLVNFTFTASMAVE